jgi:hypothetical protein
VPHFSGFDEDLEVRGYFTLSRKIRETQRAEGIVLLFFGHPLTDIKCCHNLIDDWTIDDLTID